MSKIFIVSTLSRTETLDFSLKVSQVLALRGIEAGASNFSGQFEEGKLSNQKLFENLCESILNADKIIFVGEEETPDWGALLGFAYALSKEIILLAGTEAEVPFMAARMRTRSLRVENLQDVDAYADELAEMLK